MISFQKRSHFYSDEEIQEISDYLRTSDSLTKGDPLNIFEKNIQNYLGLSHDRVIALTSAASAIELAANIAQIDHSDEIIIPGHTYTASAYPFLKLTRNIKWADIDLETRVVNFETIKPHITKKTKLIVVVHLYGYMVDIDDIRKNIDDKILILEDSAQSIGTNLNGRKSGALGDMSVISFHAHKNMTTLGEGGVLILNKPLLDLDALKSLRHNGHTNFSFEREDYWLPAMGNLDLVEISGNPIFPFNFPMTDIQAIMGSKLLLRVDQINKQKKERAKFFIKEIKKVTNTLKFMEDYSERNNYHLLVAMATDGSRDTHIRNLYKLGLQTIVQYYPLYRYDFYKKMGLGDAKCPNTDHFFDNQISFPFSSVMTDDEFNKMIQISVSYFADF